MDSGGQRYSPTALPLGKTPNTHFIGGWLSHRASLDGCGNLAPLPGFDPRPVQPVAGRYTNYANIKA